MDSSEFTYVGFWLRVWASIIDTVMIVVIALPLLIWIYGRAYWESTAMIQGPVDFLISWIFPAVAVVVFWIAKQATPGKMVIGARIVDAKTGGKVSTSKLVVRYLGYFISLIPLGLGLLWVAFDARKQGWHDKLAGTVVVRTQSARTKPVKFEP